MCCNSGLFSNRALLEGDDNERHASGGEVEVCLYDDHKQRGPAVESEQSWSEDTIAHMAWVVVLMPRSYRCVPHADWTIA